jgi:hypothetical protein
MRMLAIFCNDQYMQDLYLKSRTLPTQGSLDAGAFGDNHPFWSEMHARFHSSDHFLPFPFDYIPTKIKFTNSQGFESAYAPPQVVEKGFLKGMDLLHARKPPMYAEYFFTKQKLLELWKKSLADYRSHHTSHITHHTHMHTGGRTLIGARVERPCPCHCITTFCP